MKRHPNRSIPRWADLRPPRQPTPLSAAEQREYHAIRLALILTAGVMQSGSFVTFVQPIPGNDVERAAWLRQVLLPLVRRSPTIALLRRIIDLEGPQIAWDRPATLRRHLMRLAAEAERMGRLPRR